ncbi:unknown protein [Seminavis robusta]|uniref:Uncharacterized protein n=1 Tax=Seminavis robusta TaxID=568900 RepID=A0A9N8F2B5_9STRA|nr:unknown protein [Seminavis robusta]|eukprot:Sro3704_g350530.1 n/a (519) ;mRNA; r:3006-4678
MEAVNDDDGSIKRKFRSFPEKQQADTPPPPVETPPRVPQVTQTSNSFGVPEFSPWSQDQFASLMGFNSKKKMTRSNNNKRKVVSNKIGNGKSTLVVTKKNASSKRAPKPPPAAAVLPARAPTPSMPPLQSTRRARCEALMDKCPYPGIECNRHKCSSCGMYCHAIEPCSKEISPGILHCGVCMNLKSDSEEEDVEPTDESPDMLATQKDLEDESTEEEEEEAVANPAPAVRDSNKKKKADVQQISQFLNNTQSKEKKTRGKNFTTQEDVFVTESWCSSTEDSRSGSDQRQADFNKKFYANYIVKVDEHNDEYEEQLPKDRQQRSIVNRFGVIKHATNKLIGIMNQNPIGSGETPEGHEVRCMTMYEHATGSKFQFIECFHILKDFPKFSSANDSGKKRSDGNKQPKKTRPGGKRQKALDDKIQRALETNGVGGAASRAVSDTATVSEAIGQISTHLVDQVAVSQWADEDKEEYFKNDALEKKLLQKRRIIKLQKEIASLEQEEDEAQEDEDDCSSDEA